MLCVRSATGHNVGTTRACWVSAPSHGHFCSWWKAQLLVWFKKLYSEFLSLSAMCFTSQSGLHGSTFSQCKAGRAPLQKRLFVITLASCLINTESPVLFVRLFLTSTSLLALFPLPIKSFSSLVVGKVEGGISENVFLASFSGDAKICPGSRLQLQALALCVKGTDVNRSVVYLYRTGTLPDWSETLHWPRPQTHTHTHTQSQYRWTLTETVNRCIVPHICHMSRSTPNQQRPF